MSTGARTVTYRRRVGEGAADLAAVLGRLGLEPDPSVPARVTVLDSIDGRIHAAGARLDVVVRDETDTSGAVEVVLGGGSGPEVVVPTSDVPRLADDVPAGPLRARVAKMLDGRVLQPRVVVTTTVSDARRTNRADKATAVVRVHSHVGAGIDAAEQIVLPWSELIEVVELVGYESAAADVRDALDAAGWEAVPGDVVDVAAAWLEIDLGDRTVTPGVPLDPTMAALDAYRAVLANLRDAMVSTWEGTATDLDSEYLHDFRVAVRRTRSVLGAAKDVVPEDVRTAGGDGFKWLGDATTPPRDLDVEVIEWPDVVADFDAEVVAALEATRQHLTDDRAEAHRQLTGVLASDRAQTLLASWSAWLDGPDPEGGYPERSAGEPIGALMAKRIRRAHRRLVHAGRAITPDTPAAEVHELRKDAKKLRYLLECFGGLYEPGPRKRFVARLKALQDLLGTHQDADVAVLRLPRRGRLGARCGVAGPVTARHRPAHRTPRPAPSGDAPRGRRAVRRLRQRPHPPCPRRPARQRETGTVKVLALYSIKGGVGKTTAAVNLSAEAARCGGRVLLWDLDPQGAATFAFRIQQGQGRRRAAGHQARRAGPPHPRDRRARRAPGAGRLLVAQPRSRARRRQALDRPAAPAARRPGGPLRRGGPRLPAGHLAVERGGVRGGRRAGRADHPEPAVGAHARPARQLPRCLDDPPRMRPFVSMLDRRKTMHRSFVESLDGHVPPFLPTAIPNSSTLERMGAQRLPVASYARHSAAAIAFRALWADIAADLW